MYNAEVVKKPLQEKKVVTVALIGNPNCGKSTVFNQLTGLRQKVGNFPGVTVEKKVGKFQLGNQVKVRLVDFPGTYSLYPTSQDERVVLNILANQKDPYYPDVVVYVADITHLEQHLLLFTQVRDLGIPTLLTLNMADAARKEQIWYDTDALSNSLQVPVIAISARDGENISQLKEEISQLIEKPDQKLSSFYDLSKGEKDLAKVVQSKLQINNPYLALLVAQNSGRLPFLDQSDRDHINDHIIQGGFNRLSMQVREVMQRYDRFTPMLKKAIQRPDGKGLSLTDKIDGIVTHSIWGPVIFFALMLLVFQAIYSWSGFPMDLIDAGFANLNSFVKSTLPESWFSDLLTDGIIAGLGGILIFIPQIAILFLLISILEEVGYMARAVFMFDNVMQRFGLNGRSIVALVSGAACAIPAVMSTRTISNWKERLISIMVTPFISCSARIPVYTVLIGFVVPATASYGIFNAQGLAFMGLYLLGIIAALGSAYILKRLLHSEERSFLMLELPEYRMPVIRNILLNVWEKVKTFTIEAGRIILIVSIVLWVLASYGPGNKIIEAEEQAITLAEQKNFSETQTADLIAANKIEASYAGHLGKFIEPAIRPLGFDWKIGIALITSFAAREVFVGTMATIYSIGSEENEGSIKDRMARETNPLTGRPVYDFATSLSLLIFYVFAMMCMSTLAVVKRETNSWKWPIIQFVFMTGLAYFGSLIVYQLFK